MTVYKVTNLVNRKVYIGKTKNSHLTRWKEHLVCSVTYTSRLYSAIKKYGPDAFEVVSLYKAKTNYELNKMETFFIVLHQSFLPENGYNMTMGGDGGSPTKEVREKMSRDKKGRPSGSKRARIAICYNCFKSFNGAGKLQKKTGYGPVFCSSKCAWVEKSREMLEAWATGKRDEQRIWQRLSCKGNGGKLPKTTHTGTYTFKGNLVATGTEGLNLR